MGEDRQGLRARKSNNAMSAAECTLHLREANYIGWQFTDSILSHSCRSTIFFEGSRP